MPVNKCAEHWYRGCEAEHQRLLTETAGGSAHRGPGLAAWTELVSIFAYTAQVIVTGPVSVRPALRC